MLDAITKTLASIEDGGTFATRTRETPNALSLEVKEVGTISFPISPIQARKLIKVAKQARYGLRDQTVLDTKVRDTWEVARNRVKIDKRQWNKTLHPQLDKIQQALGLPSDGNFKAELYKMLVYEPGQFFHPHQDSEKAANMVGTMTVELPSVYRGGSTVVEHHGQKMTFRRSKKNSEELTFIAFYSDCHHEVKPITEGYRVVLVYNLIFAGVSLQGKEDDIKEHILQGQLGTYFSTPRLKSQYSREAPEPPDKLVYLLDYEYSPKGLMWEQLKSTDRLRAAALRSVAISLDYDIFLAQADVHEVWACEHGSDLWGRRRGQPKSNTGYPVVTDLIDDDVLLQTWIDASGSPLGTIQARVSRNELCFTKASQDCNPFATEHEGYTGNAGNTVEHWYHRAAIIVWPHEKSLVILAEADPLWGIEMIATTLQSQGIDAANALVEKILPRWPFSAKQVEHKDFLNKTLDVARELNSPSLAAQLLQFATLNQLNQESIPHLKSLIRSHEFTWSQELFLGWFTNTCNYWRLLNQDWLRFMPTLCHELRCSSDKGASVAKWIVEHQWGSIKSHCQQLLQNPQGQPSRASLDDLSKTIVDILDANISEESSIHDDIIQFVIASEQRFPLTTLVACLRYAQETRASVKLKELQLRPLLRHCHEKLVDATQSKPRSPEDWSITPPPGCPDTLKQFLASPSQNHLAWPLAKQGRRDVHRIIDGYKLPVKHKTLRKGSPLTLVLDKTVAVHSLALQQREQRAAELQWVEAFQHRF